MNGMVDKGPGGSDIPVRPTTAVVRARELYQAGEFSEVERLCREIVGADPGHAGAWQLLGEACQAQGRFDEAEDAVRRALELAPGEASARNALGILLAQRGRLEDAANCFLELLALRPDEVKALHNLGLVRVQQWRLEDAKTCFQQVVQMRPDFAEAHFRLGNVLEVTGNCDQARACYQQALALRPDHSEAQGNLLGLDYPETHFLRGTAFAEQGRLDEARAGFQQALRLRPDYYEARSNLGNVYRVQGQLNEANSHFREAVALRPDSPQAHNNMGIVLMEQGRLDEAITCYRAALRLRPDEPDTHNLLGIAQVKQGRLEESITSFGAALRLRPANPEFHNNLGVALIDQWKPDEALRSFRQALQIWPDYSQVHLNLGQLWLLQGDFPRGWPEYEWRARCPGARPRSFSQPAWDGSPLGARSILLYAERGLGDTLQFVRYAPLVKARGGRVILECQASLLPLLAGCPGIDELVGEGDAVPRFDVQAPLLSLPLILGTRLDNIPASVPYLATDPTLVESWRGELGEGEFKVGISWQGNSSHRRDAQRSVRLTQFAPLTRVTGVRLYSLQKGPSAEQLAAASFPVTELGSRLDSFSATAAVMKNLNLIVAVDTAVVHCAGALGVPIWVTLPFVPDWRWLLERADSPWYPTLRLFRQKEPGNWADVFQRIAQEITRMMQSGLGDF